MIHTRTLPTTDSIMHLAEVAGPFPVTRQKIAMTARHYGFDSETLRFLELFPADEVFDSREDFSVRSQELMFLMREERDMDPDYPLSSQD